MPLKTADNELSTLTSLWKEIPFKCLFSVLRALESTFLNSFITGAVAEVSKTDIWKPGHIKPNLQGQIRLEKREENMFSLYHGQTKPLMISKPEWLFVKTSKTKRTSLSFCLGLWEAIGSGPKHMQCTGFCVSMVYYNRQAVPIKIQYSHGQFLWVMNTVSVKSETVAI